MTRPFSAREARDVLRQLPDVAAQESLRPPELAHVFVPSQHAKALSLDTSVVVGMRGAGKSLWTAVLNSDHHRGFVGAQIRSSTLANAIVRVGFGLDESNTEFPAAGVLPKLVDAADPFHIWQAIVLRHAIHAANRTAPFADGDWKNAAGWIADHQSEAEKLFTECDDEIARKGRVLLVVFDALDRLGTEWTQVRRLAMQAFRLCLQLRSRRALRLKFFVRPDLDEDAEIWRFPDSSKLRHSQVELAWRSVDLYGLVFAQLANSGPFGDTFRAHVGQLVHEAFSEISGIHVLPRVLRTDEDHQRRVLELLADPYMGKDRRRGITYSWIPTHLADAVGRVSPRSYLLAFKRAAEDTAERREEHGRALRYQAIQEGVTVASQIRVQEIAEDYPWVLPLLEAARGTTVPAAQVELTRNWTPDCMRLVDTAAREKLPPRRFSTDPFRREGKEALLDDMVELGVLYRTKDGRLNMPDIFRINLGIGRKGGVKPPR